MARVLPRGNGPTRLAGVVGVRERTGSQTADGVP